MKIHLGSYLKICCAVLAFSSLLAAQTYRCDWQVISSGSCEMSGAYRCLATVGQTATGIVSDENIMAYIGFWVPEVTTGIQERGKFFWETNAVKETKLYPPMPNPFSRVTQIRYTLNAECHTLIEICDITGRVVRQLVSSTQKPGRYSVLWDGKDFSSRTVANGVYFCRFSAGDYERNSKIVLRH
ncbi:MAG: FlgD immunoglobulin-like domain containing protein [candidate division WOR-3 bacterium]